MGFGRRGDHKRVRLARINGRSERLKSWNGPFLAEIGSIKWIHETCEVHSRISSDGYRMNIGYSAGPDDNNLVLCHGVISKILGL